MNSRFNYKPPIKRDSSNDDVLINYSYEKRIKVLSTHEDGSVDKYVEECYWKEEKSSWKDYIESFDLGSPQKQVMDHLTKGTPLVTAHTLPSADYTKIAKGAEIRREMQAKGITLDMIIDALAQASQKKEESNTSEGGNE